MQSVASSVVQGRLKSGPCRSFTSRRNQRCWLISAKKDHTTPTTDNKTATAYHGNGISPVSLDGSGSASERAPVQCIATGNEAACIVDEEQELVSSSGVANHIEDAGASPSGQSTVDQITSLLLLISPFFFWGTSMVVMKGLAQHTSPLFLASVRLLPAGGLLIWWAVRSQRPLPNSGMAWLSIAAFGIVDGTCFQGFLAEGLQRTSAGLGSVIIDSQPLTVAILAALLFGEALTGAGYAGLALGLLGLCLLEVPPEALAGLPGMLLSSLGHVLPNKTGAAADASSLQLPVTSLWDSGEWWMLLAAQSMAVGTVMVRWVGKFVDPVMATGWHMILGGLPLLVLAGWREADTLVPNLENLTGADVLSLVYISVLGSAASYGVFFYNASRGNLTALSSLTFLTPMFAALGGYLFLHETLTPLQLTGAAVTLGAVFLINKKGKGS